MTKAEDKEKFHVLIMKEARKWDYAATNQENAEACQETTRIWGD